MGAEEPRKVVATTDRPLPGCQHGVPPTPRGPRGSSCWEQGVLASQERGLRTSPLSGAWGECTWGPVLQRGDRGELGQVCLCERWSSCRHAALGRFPSWALASLSLAITTVSGQKQRSPSFNSYGDRLRPVICVTHWTVRVTGRQVLVLWVSADRGRGAGGREPVYVSHEDVGIRPRACILTLLAVPPSRPAWAVSGSRSLLKPTMLRTSTGISPRLQTASGPQRGS